jgi:hypothetical protein
MAATLSLVGVPGVEGAYESEHDWIATPARARSAKKLWVPALFTALFLGIGGVAAWTCSSASRQAMSGKIGETSDKLEISPIGKKCSKASEDCSQTKCCEVSGYKCFRVNASFAGCTKAPKPGQTRLGLVPWSVSMAPPGTSLFCFTGYAADTGSAKKNYEMELLQIQFTHHTGIFGCDSQMLFSDVDLTNFPGITTVKVTAPHLMKRESSGTWINAPFYANGWKAIGEDGRWANYDWTVKIDPDTVFLPDRLKLKLSGQKVTEKGVYFTNCEHVQFGFFGNLEVISKAGFSALLGGLEECKADPKVNNVTFGEDLLMQLCMAKMGVDNVEDFYITTDDACDVIARTLASPGTKKKVSPPNCMMGTPAFHPLKKPVDYIDCLATAYGYPR